MSAPTRLAVAIPSEAAQLAADRVRDEVLRDWRDGLLSTGERDQALTNIAHELKRLTRRSASQ